MIGRIVAIVLLKYLSCDGNGMDMCAFSLVLLLLATGRLALHKAHYILLTSKEARK